jgi:hypothetical protein
MGQDALQTIERVRAEMGAIRQEQEALSSIGVQGMRRLTDATLDLTIALADGSLAFQDLGRAAGSVLSDILVDQGKQLATFAIRQGLIFKLIGNAYASLASNPLAAAGIGVALIAAGVALKRFVGSSGGGGRGAGAGGGDTAAALDRFGRRLFEREDRQGREVVIQIEDRAMRGYIGDVVADGARRGGIPLTPRR